MAHHVLLMRMSWGIDHVPVICESRLQNVQGASLCRHQTWCILIVVLVQVSQSHDLLAEILQLSSSLPAALQSSSGKYGPILFDFRFFRDPDAHEQKIEASQELTDLDEEFREVWTPITTLCMQNQDSTTRRTCHAYASHDQALHLLQAVSSMPAG